MVGGIYAVLFMLLLVFIFGTIRKMVKLALTTLLILVVKLPKDRLGVAFYAESSLSK